ncbi:MAG: signal peptidase I [Bacteroidota bacterium]
MSKDSSPARKPRSNRRSGRSRKRKDAPPKPTAKENLVFWVKAIIIIVLVRMFLVEPYRIPSESMEDTLLVHDFLLVSKLHYGTRTPATIGIPFTSIYLPGIEFPQTRLPGFSEPQRNDVVVFNYPPAVDVVRGQIPESIPIERRAPYIKRIMGVPGDTLAVLDKVVHVDGRAVPISPTMKQRWLVTSAGESRPNVRQLEEMGIELEIGSDALQGDSVRTQLRYAVTATPVEAATLEARSDVERVEPSVAPDELVGRMIYPPDSPWNPDQYGPVLVPGEGMTVDLDSTTWSMFSEVIDRYEGRDVARGLDGSFQIDGASVDSYTFTQDYYFVMGDFRDNSVDSRFWGFVPESHLIGKAVTKFISFHRLLPPIPRFSRWFRPID